MEETSLGIVYLIFKILRWIVVELFCELIAFWLGRGTLLILTLGRFPRSKHLPEHTNTCIYTGFLIFVGLFLSYLVI